MIFGSPAFAPTFAPQGSGSNGEQCLCGRNAISSSGGSRWTGEGSPWGRPLQRAGKEGKGAGLEAQPGQGWASSTGEGLAIQGRREDTGGGGSDPLVQGTRRHTWAQLPGRFRSPLKKELNSALLGRPLDSLGWNVRALIKLCAFVHSFTPSLLHSSYQCPLSISCFLGVDIID